MNKKRLFYLLALTATLCPVTPYAEEESYLLEDLPAASGQALFVNEIELGVGYASEDSFKFGEYNGLENQGAHVIGNILLQHISAYDDEKTEYWQVNAKNLGLDSRSIDAHYGHQGHFRLAFNYDQLPHFKFDRAASPFIGAGSALQTLPGNWVASNTTAGMSNLLSNLDSYSVSTERQKYSGGFSWWFRDNWQLNGEYSYESKQGQDLIAAIFGTNGGNPRGSILVQPIDYQNNDYALSLNYTGADYQFNLAYHYSRFDNADSSLTWSNPFLRLPFGNTWAPGTDFAAGINGQLAVAPDNQAQQFNFNGAYRLGLTTQLRANLSYGEMQQDRNFLAYTVNPNLAVAAALPRLNLDGEIDTLYVNLGLSTRPLRKLNLAVKYTFDNQDNNTPRDIYQLVVNDSNNQGALLSSGARINTPYSFEKHSLQVDARYRLPANSKLSASYRYQKINRDFSEVQATDEHSGSIKLSGSFNATISGWIEYTHAQRDGNGYVSNQPFLDAHNPDYIATLPASSQFINDPLLRKYTYADREQDKISGSLSIVPGNVLSFTLSGNYAHNDYPDSKLGLQKNDENHISVDVSYNPNKRLTAYAYLSREEMEHQQAGYQRTIPLFPDFVREPAPCPSCGFWDVNNQDEIYTVGSGLQMNIIDDKLRLKLDYTYAWTGTEIIADADPTVSFAELPKLRTRMHSLNLTGDYQLNDRLGLRFRYVYERFVQDDFAFDDIKVNTLSNIIGNGINSPNYAAHVLGLSLQYQF